MEIKTDTEMKFYAVTNRGKNIRLIAWHHVGGWEQLLHEATGMAYGLTLTHKAGRIECRQVSGGTETPVHSCSFRRQ